MNTQYKKGVLELCVLSLLQKHDRYGYEISETLPDTSTSQTGRSTPFCAS